MWQRGGQGQSSVWQYLKLYKEGSLLVPFNRGGPGIPEAIAFLLITRLLLSLKKFKEIGIKLNNVPCVIFVE